jgi:4-diphosphocytidyl-2-C-methyl-D-erythritol kinase
VLERRPDGFHNLESIFSLLNWGDELEIEILPPAGEESLAQQENGPGRGGGALAQQENSALQGAPGLADDVSLSLLSEESPPPAWFTGLAALPPEKNLAYRAAKLFLARTGLKARVNISLVKRVPPLSGLGGGSSDAAAVLLCLNRLAAGWSAGGSPSALQSKAAAPADDASVRLQSKAAAPAGEQPLSDAALLELAAELGSDVPFFIACSRGGFGAAWVTGRGEFVKPLKAPPQNYGILIVKPEFSSSTAESFKKVDEFFLNNEKKPRKNAEFSKFTSALSGNPAQWPFFNDFQQVFLAEGGANSAQYGEILRLLAESGAFFAGISGSGSSCFGIFVDITAARVAKRRFESKMFTKTTNFLAFP